MGYILSVAARTWISLHQSRNHSSIEELKVKSFTVQCNKVKAKRTSQVQVNQIFENKYDCLYFQSNAPGTSEDLESNI